MSEWKKVKLGDISSAIQTGPFGSQLHQSDYSDIGVPVVMPKDIINGSIDESTIARVESHHVERLSRHKISEGDILYARRGDVGKCAYTVFAQQGWLCGTGCLRVTIDKQKALPKFVFYQLQKRETIGWVEKHAIGATMLNLNTSILSDVPIDLPSLTTQHHIATILSRYDSLIENYQKQIKLLEEAAQRLYKEWFVDLHFPGHETTKIVDGVPEGWKKNTINDVCTLITSGSTPSRNKNSYWEDGTFRWVKTKELLDSWILDTEEYITQEGYNNSSTKLFPANTILMAIYASPTLGRLGILSAECCCNQAALGLIADEKVISWQWLFWKLYELRDEFNAIARGAGQQNISGIVVKNKEIVIPAKRVIDGFTSVVSTMFEQQKNLQLQIRILTEARNRLLPKLMNGEINVGEERPERPKSA